MLETGTVIDLKTVPVDPRSLFRGDYVTLSYEITRFEIEGLPGDKDFQRGDKAYITLSQATGHWLPVAAHKQYPKAKNEDVVVRGRVQSTWGLVCFGNDSPAKKVRCRNVKGLRVHYGIESFFVPEGKGRPIEHQRNEGKVTVQVAIDDKGQAGIKALSIDGEVVFSETLF